MFHFPKDKNTNPTFQAVSRNRLKQDYCYLFNLIRQLGPQPRQANQRGPRHLHSALLHRQPQAQESHPPRQDATRPRHTAQGGSLEAHIGPDQAGIPEAVLELNLPDSAEDCEPVGRGPGSRWVCADKLRDRRAKREIREQRKAYRRKNLTQCP